MHILYLEDEPNDARLVKRFIDTTPHQITIVSDLDDARKALTQNPTPNLILVDILVQDERQGYDFIRETREKGYTEPIIALTGLTLAQDLEECYSSGCNEIIAKPFTINQLDTVLTNYANKRGT